MPADRAERMLIAVLCLLAGLRILVFNAAFPPFNNIDEQRHFDLVYRYAHGDVPTRGVTPYGREVATFFTLYGSPEYLNGPGRFPDGIPPAPLWTYAEPHRAPAFQQQMASWSRAKNFQAWMYPFYYATAGAWWRLGEAAGLEGGTLIYWIRFLNVPMMMALVWTAAALARAGFPDRRLLRLGVPLLIAFVPQDVFYAINNDTPAALLFALAFLGLLHVRAGTSSTVVYAATGAAVAATVLTKLTNVPALLIVVVVVGLTIARLRSGAPRRAEIPRAALLLAVAVTPIVAWLVRNALVLGDLLGGAEKEALMGWTRKPLGEILDHPVFTLEGCTYVLGELTVRLWRGELTWHARHMRSPIVDGWYLATTALCVLASAVGLLVARHRSALGRFTLAVSLVAYVAWMAYIAALPLAHDFGEAVGNRFLPSPERPYYLGGRLMLGALVPFAIVYVDGLGRLFARGNGDRAPLIVLAVMMLAITVHEVALTVPVFSSRYNWFHLP